jgi:hypothetical protein
MAKEKDALLRFRADDSGAEADRGGPVVCRLPVRGSTRECDAQSGAFNAVKAGRLALSRATEGRARSSAGDSAGDLTHPERAAFTHSSSRVVVLGRRADLTRLRDKTRMRIRARCHLVSFNLTLLISTILFFLIKNPNCFFLLLFTLLFILYIIYTFFSITQSFSTLIHLLTLTILSHRTLLLLSYFHYTHSLSTLHFPCFFLTIFFPSRHFNRLPSPYPLLHPIHLLPFPPTTLVKKQKNSPRPPHPSLPLTLPF